MAHSATPCGSSSSIPHGSLRNTRKIPKGRGWIHYDPLKFAGFRWKLWCTYSILFIVFMFCRIYPNFDLARMVSGSPCMRNLCASGKTAFSGECMTLHVHLSRWASFLACATLHLSSKAVWIISTIRPSNEYIGNHFPQIFQKKTLWMRCFNGKINSSGALGPRNVEVIS